MFWGCFTYDHKGPCHIYYPETDEQKQYYQDLIDEENDNEIEAKCRAEFDK
jgi:hypothetical protein